MKTILNLHVDNKTSLAAFLLISLMAFALIVPIFAQATEVSTDKAIYAQGDSVTITGAAAADQFVAIQVKNPTGTSILMSTVTADADGVFTKTFKLPADTTLGDYAITATEGGETATASFTVGTGGDDTTAPTLTISVSPDKSNYGAETVTISVTTSEPLAVAPLVVVTQADALAASITMTTVSSTSYTGDYEVVSDYDGTATIDASGDDLSTNTGTASATFTVTTATEAGASTSLEQLQADVSQLQTDVASLQSGTGAILSYLGIVIAVIAIVIAGASVAASRKK